MVKESGDSFLQIPSTHPVAVTGYVYRQGRFLLLKRAQPPLIWTPPGGRLAPLEDPKEGVVREVREETGLEVRPVGLIDYWYGEIPSRGRLLSLDFLTLPQDEEVRLSEEHTDFAWASLADLEKGNPPLGTDRFAYRIADFQKVESEFQRMRYFLPASDY
jgi:8-oxo-dGTP pyrophosphatase MutT (NUDIX family)